MNIDQTIFAFAGAMILASLLLSWLHNSNWIWLAAFVGINMLQSSFTGFCPAATLLKKIGMKPGNAI